MTQSGSEEFPSQVQRLVERALAARTKAKVKLDVHDASRLEWSVALPMPATGIRHYAVHVAFDIPGSVYVDHDPWAQLQAVMRLDGGAEPFGGVDSSLDLLRQSAVTATQRLSRAGDGFARHARLAASLAAVRAEDDLGGTLRTWLHAAATIVDDVRARLVTAPGDDPPALRRERRLVDEYVSTRFIETLAGAERALTLLAASRSPFARDYADVVEGLEADVGAALEAELQHRARCGYVRADASSPESLEHYVDRASLLKKHFHEVFFLDKTTVEIAKRIHHWVAALVALLASTWAFAWQIALATRGMGGADVGPRVLMLAALAGLIYAGKDRIKEVGRTWISGHVHRLYAQRVVRFRVPARRLASGDMVAVGREAFEERGVDRPDPLHPGSGAIVRVMELRYRLRGDLLPCPEGLTAPGMAATGGASVGRRVKLIFRYDFSPLFARLADAVRKVPVLDAETHRLAFCEAPRRYRVPVRIVLTLDDATHEEEAVLVLSKRGLERLEKVEGTSALDTLPGEVVAEGNLSAAPSAAPDAGACLPSPEPASSEPRVLGEGELLTRAS